MTATEAPFMPRVLRSDAGSVAVEVGPRAPDAPDFTDLYQLVTLGPDGIEFLTRLNLPRSPGAMLSRDLLRAAPDVLCWRELTAAPLNPSPQSGKDNR